METIERTFLLINESKKQILRRFKPFNLIDNKNVTAGISQPYELKKHCKNGEYDGICFGYWKRTKETVKEFINRLNNIDPDTNYKQY